MKNLKIITLLWIILISWTLIGCDSDKDSNNENPSSNTESTTQEISPVETYYNDLMDIASRCLNSEQTISDTYNNPSASTIDVKIAINTTLNQCLNATEEIQTKDGREWNFSLNEWIINVLGRTVEYYSKFSEYLSYEENGGEYAIEDESAPILANVLSELEILKENLDNATNELKATQEEFANLYWLVLKD